MGKKKLLIITQAVDPTDSALGFFCEWIENFASDPHVATIEVWCLRRSTWLAQPSNVTVRVLPHGRVSRLALFFRLLVTCRFDAVFVHMSPVWAVLGGWWWRITNQRVVLWYTHGTGSMMLRWAVRFADATVTATKEAFPIASPKVVAVGHGIGAAFFDEPRIPSAEGLRLLAVGRITPRKRIKETVEFFSLIAALRPTAKLTVIGEPITADDRTYASEVHELVRQRGLTDRVSFHGAVPYVGLPALYSASDLLLHLSATGSLDKVVLEALAAGCAVFSTNPATAEAVNDACWDGPLDASAATEAVRRAEAGVSLEQRRDVAAHFSLRQLVSRLASTCFPAD